MLQPIINKINALERKIKEAMNTDRDIKDVRECIAEVLHDLVHSLELVNQRIDVELANGKFTIVKELIDEEFSEQKYKKTSEGEFEKCD
jgi:hypothetical protein